MCRSPSSFRSLGSLLAACGSATEWERPRARARIRAKVVRALEIFHTSELRNVYTYGAALAACAEGGAWPQALELLREARKA